MKYFFLMATLLESNGYTDDLTVHGETWETVKDSSTTWKENSS